MGIEGLKSLIEAAAQMGGDTTKIDSKKEARKFLDEASIYSKDNNVSRADIEKALAENSAFSKKTQKKVDKLFNEIFGIDISGIQDEKGSFANKKELKEAGYSRKERNAYKEQAKTDAKALVMKYVKEAESQDAKYIKTEVKERLEKEGLWNEYTKDALNGGVSLAQWLKGEQSDVKYARQTSSARNRVNFRAYNEDGSAKEYTEDQIVNGYKYTDSVSGKTIKVKGLKQKNLDDMMANGANHFDKLDNGNYTIANASKTVRLVTGSDYTADTREAATESEQKEIANEFGLKARHSSKNGRRLAKHLGFNVVNPFDGAEVARKTGEGAVIGGLAGMAAEALSGNKVVDASTSLKMNDVLNVDCGTAELAEQFADKITSSTGAAATVIGATVKIVTKIDLFDPNIFTIAKDVLGHAATGAITGAIAGFASGLLNSHKNEKNVLPELNCRKNPTLKSLEAYLTKAVENKTITPETKRIAMMVAKANADKNGNINCDTFAAAWEDIRGNNVNNRRELINYDIDNNKKPETTNNEQVLTYDAEENCGTTCTKTEEVKVPTTKGVLWPNLAAQYECLNDYVPSEKARIRMMKVIQAVTDNNYTIENLKALTEKAIGLGDKASDAQIREAFKDVKGFNVETYINVLRASIIGEQKVPVIILPNDGKCERNTKIKGSFTVTNKKAANNKVSSHTGDTKTSTETTPYSATTRTSDGKTQTYNNQNDYKNGKAELEKQGYKKGNIKDCK